MRAAIIINPISGRLGRRPIAAAERTALAYGLSRELGVDARVEVTRARGHGVELAAALVSQGVDRVVAWGGDGTVNEIAGPLVGTPTALGIVPSGSGDGFARGLKLPRPPDAALRLALTGTPKAVDVGYLGVRHFLNVAGIGFDAAVGQIFNQRTKRGAAGYFNAFSLVWGYRPPSYTLDIDGTALPGERFLIVFANGREYGNGAVIAPDASFDDGKLDAVVVAAGSPWRQLWRARRLVIGRRRPAEGVMRQRFTTARVTGDALHCHVDGETFEFGGTLEVRLAPLALRVAR